jgi:hypothetical protein
MTAGAITVSALAERYELMVVPLVGYALWMLIRPGVEREAKLPSFHSARNWRR